MSQRKCQPTDGRRLCRISRYPLEHNNGSRVWYLCIYIMCMGCRMNRYNTRGIVTHKVYACMMHRYYVYIIWYVYNIKYVIDNNIIISIRRDRKHNVGVFDILISWDFREKNTFCYRIFGWHWFKTEAGTKMSRTTVYI